CDMLSATGRKFLRGPRGTGFLYVRESVLERLDPPMIDHHAASWVARDRYELRPDARRVENWEASYSDRLGEGAAVDHAPGWGIGAIHDRAWALAADLRERLAAISGVEVRDIDAVRSAIVTFTVEGIAPAAIKAALASRAMNVTVAEADSARLDME